MFRFSPGPIHRKENGPSIVAVVKKPCQFAMIITIFMGKRSAVFIILGFLFLTIVPNVVLAQEQSVIVKPKTSVSNTYSLPFSTGNTQIDAFLGRIFHPPQQVNIPKLDKYAVWMENSLQALLPQTVNEKLVRDTKPRKVSMSYRYCACNTQTGECSETTSDQPVITDPDPAINSLVTGSVTLNSLYGTGEKIQNNQGNYDYNYVTELIGPAEKCGADSQGDLQDSKTVNTNAPGSTGGGLFSTILGWFSRSGNTDGNVTVTKTESINGDQYARAMCSAGGNCTEKDLADLPETERNSLKPGGVMDTFLPESIKAKETDGQTQGSDTDKDLVYQKTKAVQKKSDQTKCLLIPASLQAQYGLQCSTTETAPIQPKDCGSYFTNPAPGSDAKTGGSSSGGPLGYGIPFRNPSCVFQNKEAVAEYASAWLGGNEKARSAVLENFDTIVKYAQEYNWSPAFVMTLWIEESAAGAYPGAHQMGCVFRNNEAYENGWKRMDRSSPVCEQLACLIDYPNQPTFQSFIYNYSGDGKDYFNPAYNKNPCFATNIFNAYTHLTSRAGLPEGCAATGSPSRALMTLYQSCK